MRPGITTLRTLPLLQSFDDDLLDSLNESADLARLGPGEDVFNEGERSGQIGILLAGYVAITRSLPGGGEVTADVVGPIAAIGIASAWLETAEPVTARTITPARIVFLPAREVKAAIAAEPRLALPFLDFALNEIGRLNDDVCQLRLRSSIERLAEYLLGLIDDPEQSPARFVLPYEKRFLAAKIGCSQANLSRAFATLRRIGVGTRQSGVIVRDVAALRALTGIPSPSGRAARDAVLGSAA